MTLLTTKKILQHCNLLICPLNTPRYRRGASLVRVGPILLALGGRRRARSYNSVEVVTTIEMIVTDEHDVDNGYMMMIVMMMADMMMMTMILATNICF